MKQLFLKAAGLTLIAQLSACSSMPATKPEPASKDANSERGGFFTVEKPPLTLKPVKKETKPVEVFAPAKIEAKADAPAAKPAPKAAAKTVDEKPVEASAKVTEKQPEKTVEKSAVVAKVDTPVTQPQPKAEPLPVAPKAAIHLVAGAGVKTGLKDAAIAHGYTVNWEGEELFAKYDAAFEGDTFEAAVNKLLVAIRANGYVEKNGKVIYVVVQ